MSEASNNVAKSSADGLPDPKTWRTLVAPFLHPSPWRSWWQLGSALIPYLGIMVAMYFTLSVNFWITAALGLLAAGLLVRLFIIFHDCGHGAFFKSRRLNDIVGFITGVISYTPYEHWRHLHAMHHATSGNLDKRAANQTYPVKVWKYIEDGYGLLTLTTDEYRQLNRWQKLGYKIYRHPLFLLVFIPPLQFLLFQRMPASTDGPRERRSVHLTNLAWLVITLVLGFTVGFGPYLVVTLLISIPSSIAGVWLFYIQHQYEEMYWKYQDEWNYYESAVLGSSFYKLPAVLQYFSGNIGFHHVHHLNH
jgi:omega-6 fatty acid desaturase (delta-12 desaturase)